MTHPHDIGRRGKGGRPPKNSGPIVHTLILRDGEPPACAAFNDGNFFAWDVIEREDAEPELRDNIDLAARFEAAADAGGMTAIPQGLEYHAGRTTLMGGLAAMCTPYPGETFLTTPIPGELAEELGLVDTDTAA